MYIYIYISQSSIYLRVPSKRVAIVSKKVFCGARRPFLTGIGATPPRCHALESEKIRNTILIFSQSHAIFTCIIRVVKAWKCMHKGEGEERLTGRSVVQ